MGIRARSPGRSRPTGRDGNLALAPDDRDHAVRETKTSGLVVKDRSAADLSVCIVLNELADLLSRLAWRLGGA